MSPNTQVAAGRRPAQQVGPVGRVGQGGLEQLADRAEAEGPFQLAAPRREHPRALGGGQPAYLLQQPGLADAGRALDQGEAALPGHRLGERGAQSQQLAVAVDDLLTGWRRCRLTGLRPAGPRGGDAGRRDGGGPGRRVQRR